MYRCRTAPVVFFIILLCTLLAVPQLWAQAVLRNAFPNLSFAGPVGVVAPPDSTNRIFVVSQPGTIYDFPNSPDAASANVFLDISSTVLYSGEMGFLGLAFHPEYRTNGYFYVYYNVSNNVQGFPYASVISRFRVSGANPDSADPQSETVLLRVNQPFPNHKGGQLAFGPDGYLYIGLGDGGSGGDPLGNGQNTATWLGKILRINVDSAAPGLNYSIPATNPFASDTSSSVKKEIYAYGLRNPWRFSFDAGSGGKGFVADVGQDTWEEIDTLVNGGNYGWNTKEGYHCFNPSSGCDSTGLKSPIWEYGHVNGQCSITGGFVYRGTDIPALRGRYVYADYCAGRIWSFDIGRPAVETNSVLINSGKNISSFGVDSRGELYCCSLGDGAIEIFAALPPVSPALLLPANLQTGVPRSPRLIWSTAYNASRYRIQAATDSLFAQIVYDDSVAGDTSVQLGQRPYSSTIFWRVRSSNSGGSSAYSATRKFRIQDPPAPPPPPVLVSPQNGATDQPSIVRLVWNSASTADRYECQIAYDTGFTHPAFPDSAIADTSLWAGPFPVDTTCYWRVRGINASGNGDFSAVNYFMTSHASLVYTLHAGWNLVSLPLVTADPAASNLFPGAASHVFGYPGSGSYVVKDTLQPGPGYWIKYTAGTTLAISGIPVAGDSFALGAGWNMIGSVSQTVAVASLTVAPPSVTLSSFFAYAGRYIITDSLAAGNGYWVHSGSPAVLYAGSFAFSRTGTAPVVVTPISGLPPGPPGVDAVNQLPSATKLAAAYPNPFNPSVRLRFTNSSRQMVVLEIHDILGREIATLARGVMDPGEYTVSWDASGNPGGIYFCRLTTAGPGGTTATSVSRLVYLK
jgi:glucose/arabinose dehydrogenase